MSKKLPRELTVLLVADVAPPVEITLQRPTEDLCPGIVSDVFDRLDYEVGRAFASNIERRDLVRSALQAARDIAAKGATP